MKGLRNKSSSSESSSEEENDSYHTSRDNEEEGTATGMEANYGDDTESMNTGDEAGEERSDPIVVNQPSSPPAYGQASDSAIREAEKFDKIKEQEAPSFIQAGFQKKATPLALKPWAALALTLDGRDKITKVLQYISRFLGWWFTGRSRNQSVRFTTLYKQLANSRKAYRLGRSFIELEKLRPFPGLILWHLENYSKDESEKSRHPDVIMRRASSNIGWGPSTADEERANSRSLVRSLSSMAYRKMYRPMLSRMSSTFAPSKTPSEELWKVCGMSIKILGLLGFWAGDNCNFFFSTGALDNYSLSNKDRIERRKRWMTFASTKANQSYFIGSVAGLMVNWYAYRVYHREKIANLEQDLPQDTEEEEPEDEEITIKLKQKQFSLFLSLLKSCCDVMVFSNQPGIDLHKKWRGEKNHEGFHCLCGLLSAGTVIYNNFPDSN